MKIYGVAILAGCFLAGQLIGEVLGVWLGVEGNVGGVGFAMLFLILLSDYLKKNNLIEPESEQGVMYWSAMYIPVVVAMSSIQNVKAALSGGWVAVIVGVLGTGVSFLLVPIIAKLGKPKTQNT
jgi:malonate transporter MadL subunit